MSTDADSFAHELADRYRVERELGRGASAVVYLATDLKHGRRVALKLLSASERSVSHERFLEEIRTTARLHHPYLLPLYDSGEVGDRLFFSMPFVETGTLRDRLKRDGRIPVGEALRVVRQAGRALEYTHSQEIVHRDVKPENILLSAAGDALVTDFGIAFAFDGARRGFSTGDGIVIGTPAYMSPEQMLGARDLDARSDLYSLACVLFEMLAGRPPFVAPNPRELLNRRLFEDPPAIRTVAPDVPVPVERALTRALARNPADRFENIADFLDALAQPSTFRILALGGLTTLAEGTPVHETEIPAQAMALLALLAHAAPHGVPREHAAMLLWSRAEPDEARRHLARDVRALQRELGLGDALAAGRTLALRGEAVSSDVTDFRAALAAGDMQRAVMLYEGPFLQGVRVADAPLFEEWMCRARRELDASYRAALEKAARDATRRRDHALATLWWRRLAQEDPLNGRVNRGLMLALVAAGDRSGALRQAEMFEALIEEELGIPPDHDVVRLAESIRKGADVAPLAETLEYEVQPAPPARAAATPRRDWRLVVTVVVLGIALVIALTLLLRRPRAAPSPARAPVTLLHVPANPPLPEDSTSTRASRALPS
jgi:DNA-binding SARP family transcriptional activator